MFHFRQDDEHDDDDILSTIPFPRSSPPISTSPLNLPPNRSSSHPVLLSNGKPLKSSLKSSSSAPAISPPPPSNHLRARSAPSTPNNHIIPPHSKNVHFAERDGLTTVCVFKRSAKPASLSHPPAADDTETETETESNTTKYFYNPPLPFLHIPASRKSTYHSSSPPSPPSFELDKTSPIPAPDPFPYANVHLESLDVPLNDQLNQRKPPSLIGTLVVRNITFEKHVAVRFTLDDWQTVSEVSARHIASVPSLPPALAPRTIGDAVGAIAKKDMWDRFVFTIKLEDYAFKLHERVLWLVARFRAGSSEWWDNNRGQNYRVTFKTVAPSRRPLAVSAPGTKFIMRLFGFCNRFVLLQSNLQCRITSTNIHPRLLFRTQLGGASASSISSITQLLYHPLLLPLLPLSVQSRHKRLQSTTMAMHRHCTHSSALLLVN